jgi:hypothetical protein
MKRGFPILIFALLLFSPALLAQPSRVEKRSFFSNALGLAKNHNLYSPAGYGNSSERYPIAYFLKGNESEWFDATRLGRAGADLASPPFWVDVLYFRAGDEDTTLTGIYLEIPYALFTFVKARTGYEAGATVGVAYTDADGFQIDGNSIIATLCADGYEATLSRCETHLFRLAFPMTPGDYTVRIVVDDHYAGKQLSSVFKINVPSFRPPQLQISSLLLARPLEQSEQASPWRKSGRLIIPNVQRNIDGKNPLCFLYFEVYNLEPVSSSTDSLQLHYSISGFGQTIRSGRWRGAKLENKIAVSLPLQLNGLAPGEYVLTVRIADQNSKHDTSASSAFNLLWQSPCLSSRQDLSRSIESMMISAPSNQ